MHSENIFPLTLPIHIIFVLIGTGYFIYRFFNYKKPYQLILAIDIFLTLFIRAIPHIKDDNTANYVYDASMYIEFGLLIIGVIWAIIESHRYRKNKKLEKDSEQKEELKQEENI